MAIEDGLPHNFVNRVGNITKAHDSWAASLAAVDGATEISRFNGKEINLIFTKG
ncbi:MAG: hypothetical protein RAK19_00795 [Synechococcus sp. SP1 MAG]|nr:hypothetical protein [Synechococcus sp. SP1 MAG]